ncbi:MAG: 50S ribosomal protein L23, partial [bacterium]
YSFKVAKTANRIEIKEAVEKIFDVKVRKVNTVMQNGKRRRVGRSIGFTSAFKKAFVTLEPGFEIDLL